MKCIKKIIYIIYAAHDRQETKYSKNRSKEIRKQIRTILMVYKEDQMN